MNFKLMTAAAVVILAGCQTSAPPPAPQPAVPVQTDPNDPLFWGRQDCKRLSSSPEIKASFDSDKAACEAQTGLPADQITVGSIYYCMADKGYNYRTRSEHDKACTGRSARR